MLLEAIRYHRRLEREAIDPRTWLRWILFLPRDWLDYLGWRTVRTRMLVTAVQLLYWPIPSPSWPASRGSASISGGCSVLSRRSAPLGGS
ncbi:MAG: hypothetical protein U0610_08780 [bacterium]